MQDINVVMQKTTLKLKKIKLNAWKTCIPAIKKQNLLKTISIK